MNPWREKISLSFASMPSRTLCLCLESTIGFKSMASISADNSIVPITVPVGVDGKVAVQEQFLSAKFKLCIGTMYVEQELHLESGDVMETVLQQKSQDDDGGLWILGVGKYKVFGLTNSQMQRSTLCLAPMSMPTTSKIHLSPFVPVKVEPGQETVTLLSDSDEDIVAAVDLADTSANPYKSTLSFSTCPSAAAPAAPHTWSRQSFHGGRPPQSPTSSSNPTSMLDALKAVATRRRSHSPIADIDFDNIKISAVKYLPTTYNGDVIFLLPPLPVGIPFNYGKGMDGMDKHFDGHPWCITKTSNVRNDGGLSFRRSSCAGHLECQNNSCQYFLVRNPGVRNCTQWSGQTSMPFNVGCTSPENSTLHCKVCFTPPACLALCPAHVYYVFSSTVDIQRACIHLGWHDHLVADGVCRESVDESYKCVATEVYKTPKATTSAIQMAASQAFLSDYLFNTPTQEEKQLNLESVMDKFSYLASPNCRNIVSGSKRVLKPKAGPMESIIALKNNPKFKFVHENRFPGQSNDKVFVFKMSVDLEGSGVDLVRRMQPGGDLQDSWIMFDHVKRVDKWTTMACHVYDSRYCKVLTVAICDMQSEDHIAQILFWENLNKVMANNGVPNVNFKGFMADSAQANWMAVRRVYGSGDPKVPMEDRERSCFFHWMANLDKYTTKHIKLSLQVQHKKICLEYRDAKTMPEAEVKYHAIRAWWLSAGAATEDDLIALSEWLGFWHYRYRQWGGKMILVSPMSPLLMDLYFAFEITFAMCILKRHFH